MNAQLDQQCNVILSLLGYNSEIEDIEIIHDDYAIEKTQSIAKEIGIDMNDKLFNINLLNDNVNDFAYVVKVVGDVCQYDYKRSYQLTQKAHETGKSTLRTGKLKYVMMLKQQLATMGLSTSINTTS